MTLILTSGHVFVGKDTFVDYLVSKYEGKAVKLSLAAKLKTLTFKLLQTFNISIDSIEELDNRETKEKYRYYLQHIATECIRSTFGKNFWCKQIVHEVRSNLQAGNIVIISDVRFKNEQEYFQRKFNSYPIYKVLIKRQIADNVNSTTSSHSSEDTSQLTFNYAINNDSTIENFHQQIDEFCDKFNLNEPDEHLIDLPEPDEDTIVVERSPIEPTINIESNNQAFNDSAFIAKMNEHNNSNTSQYTGVIGEEYVLNLIRNHVRPENETNIISHQAHVADLESFDDVHHIRWVIEVKNKDNLTRNDVDKFKSDVLNITKQNTSRNVQVVGLFVSLRSNSIPRIGDLFISKNEIYLSKSFVSVDALKIVFSFVEQYSDLFNTNQSTPTASNQSIEYVLPERTIRLMSALNTDYQRTSKDIELYDEMKRNCKSNLANLEELTISAQLRKRLISLLDEHLNVFEPIIETSTADYQYQQFVDSLKSVSNVKNIQKQQTIRRYPLLIEQINKSSWEDYKTEAFKLAHKDDMTNSMTNSMTNLVSSSDPELYSSLEPEEQLIVDRINNETEYTVFKSYMKYLSTKSDLKTITKSDLTKNYNSIVHVFGNESWIKIRKILQHLCSFNWS